jgi:micrococcal nuclease
VTRLGSAVVMVLMICACRAAEQVDAGGSVPDAAGPKPQSLVTGTVIRVNDGDSIVVATGSGDIEVRLMGINTPERDECLGQEAEGRLSDLVDGREVGLEAVGQDQFDRILAYVWIDDRLVNLDQVEDGLAIATTPEEGDPHGPAIIAAENLAFEEGLGMWSASACGASGPVPSVEVSGENSSFDPRGPDEELLGEEWITLSSVESVELEGWVIRDESSQHRCHVPSGVQVDPGTELSVASNDPCWDPGGIPVWNNEGDMALLLDPSGRVVARYRYQG